MPVLVLNSLVKVWLCEFKKKVFVKKPARVFKNRIIRSLFGFALSVGKSKIWIYQYCNIGLVFITICYKLITSTDLTLQKQNLGLAPKGSCNNVSVCP